MRRNSFSAQRDSGERGFSWVEFAILVPVGLIIALVVTEAVWFFVARDDINVAADEGARLASLNVGTAPQIGQTICAGVEVQHPTASPDVIFKGEAGSGIAGDVGKITLKSPIRSFTGVLTPLFRTITLSATREFTLRRPLEGSALWWNDGQETRYSCR